MKTKPKGARMRLHFPRPLPIPPGCRVVTGGRSYRGGLAHLWPEGRARVLCDRYQPKYRWVFIVPALADTLAPCWVCAMRGERLLRDVPQERPATSGKV